MIKYRLACLTWAALLVGGIAHTQSLNALDAQYLLLDAQHLLLDGSLTDEEADARPYTFNKFADAAAHFGDTVTLYLRPWVYWVDNPDVPEVVVGKDGREPFGCVIHAKIIHFIGLGEHSSDVVLASQRGQTQGAVGNFTMFDFHVDSLIVEHLTMGNYCNVDLDYPLHPELSRKKRNPAITQAHVGYVHGQQLVARDVRFISRLNLNPLNGAQESYYEDCHFECTDDAMNGTAIYRHCTVDLYGQKPFWSTFGRGAMFIDCDFYVKSDNREMYFCKQGGPLTLIDCRYHAPSDNIYIGWTAYPQRWLRCYQQGFTLNGKPYLIGNRQPENTVLLHDCDAMSIPFQPISLHQATLLTGHDSLLLSAPNSQWRVQPGFEQYISFQPVGRDSIVVIPSNTTDETAEFCIEAYGDKDGVAACELIVKPCELPPPVFIKTPSIEIADGEARLNYSLDLTGAVDESSVIWYKTDYAYNNPFESDALLPFAVGRSIRLTDAEIGHVLTARILPKSSRSISGSWTEAQEPMPVVKKKHVKVHRQLETDFSDIPCDWQPEILPGFWTVDGYKPTDTAEFPWNFDSSKPMWKYGEGFNGAVGKGLLQEQRGARIMYTPQEKTYGDMSVTLQVDPTKTAGQGFGSATGQYIDVCLKFDTKTLTGYGLRIIRTTKSAKAVDFLLVKYDDGLITPISEAVTSTCYRTGCTIHIEAKGRLLTAHVCTTTQQPTGSTLPHEVSLSAPMEPTIFGGIHIQHTGSCGESTTMLHQLKATWK